MLSERKKIVSIHQEKSIARIHIEVYPKNKTKGLICP